jgi:hypothetical protein
MTSSAGARRGGEKILVAFDFSSAAERALAWAADQQRRLGDPEVHVMRAR